MNQYQYSSLRKSCEEFRLLSLLPGPASADIELEIFHVNRFSKPKYEALSYVWGPPERTDIAFIHEQEPVKPLSQLMGSLGLQKRNNDSKPATTIGITRNLAIALRHLRYPAASRVLWIDALCINQDDLPERSAEVLKMGSIYSNARDVIVWLGPSSADSRIAIETLLKLGKDTIISAERHSLTCKTGSWAELLIYNVDALKSNASSWIAIRDLLRREWFTRLWVFQEIGLATNAIVVVGEERIDWQVFQASLVWLWFMRVNLNQHIENLAMEDFAISSISGFMGITERLNSSGQNIYALLIWTNKLYVSDPRDRLYAIRGLAAPKESKLIIPDYSKSVEEVFKDFTVRFIQEHETGNILNLCLLRNTPSNLQLPSWVPDLSPTNNLKEFLGFRASGVSRLVAVNNHQNLAVQGVQVATITHLMPFVAPSNTVSEVIELCQSWQQLCPSGNYIGGRSTFDAFLEAVLFGHLAELLPPEIRGHLSLKECKRILECFGAEYGEDKFDPLAGIFADDVGRHLWGRAFFKTQEGFFGACPESANSGDQVVILLGCYNPLVLRPVTLQGITRYCVIGECCVPGVMHGEVLLGPLPVGWSVRCGVVAGEVCELFTHGETVTQKDPRMPPLPPPWRYRYKGAKSFFHNSELNRSGHIRNQWFNNIKTKEITWADPRLTPKALQERGVNIHEFVLV